MSTSHNTSPDSGVRELTLAVFWPLLVIISIAINLRPTLTATGPLLADIQNSTGIALQAASLLTVLPMLCMGLFPLLLPWLGKRITETSWITAGLAAIGLASLWRFYIIDGLSLILSALLAGCGIAILQALAPGIAKRWYPRRVPLVMGVYSASLMAGGGVAAIVSPLVAHYYDHWQSGLGIWLIPTLLAILLWWLRPGETLSINTSRPAINFFTNRRSWLLAAYFGLANGGYACIIAWLPSYARSLGWSAQSSGELIAIMTIFQVMGALLAPLLSTGSQDRRPWLFLAMFIQLSGFLGLMLLSEATLTLWVALIGWGLGAGFSLTLTVALDHFSAPQLAGALTAFVQGIGFILTAAIPYVAGILIEWSGSFYTTWLMLIMTLILLLGLTLIFSPASYAKAIRQK